MGDSRGNSPEERPGYWGLGIAQLLEVGTLQHSKDSPISCKSAVALAAAIGQPFASESVIHRLGAMAVRVTDVCKPLLKAFKFIRGKRAHDLGR